MKRVDLLHHPHISKQALVPECPANAQPAAVATGAPQRAGRSLRLLSRLQGATTWP